MVLTVEDFHVSHLIYLRIPWQIEGKKVILKSNRLKKVILNIKLIFDTEKTDFVHPKFNKY